jgi:hypothetical protein
MAMHKIEFPTSTPLLHFTLQGYEIQVSFPLKLPTTIIAPIQFPMKCKG